ncbi:IS66 family transposase [Rhodoferax sp. TBRC 17198]|uniref:IS66 family transposase n=1 Tax=Rhodoferax potami TaxID=3068338 RepID=UPI0028BF29DA|nr:IS66 family transposase [Rhodoferax sp. TBRC 17198]MDT7521075.1 IS66 family transposase [Rhodoferax sp. TBRC 17198]MDT7523109.1 IS66 family transposase [Rhodoferax sp. TBRC 17198]MDT7524465.1 IS66 family transposase [Rhodoferax sp. TBRC 17198]
MVFTPDSLQQMSAYDVCNLVSGLMEKVSTQSKELLYRQSKIDQLTHEMATLKRLQFGRSREQLDATQTSLLDEACDEDLAAIEQELKNLTPTPKPDKDHRSKPKRAALPDHLPRVEIHHEPDSTTCTCGCQLKRIGQDVAQKLDYTPGVFTVELHVRGKWACGQCETLIQAPVPAQVIDKGIPTAGLLAQVLVAKYADHLPLYRQEKIFGRAGLEIACSTLGAWVGMCGVQLQPLVDALKETVLSHAVVHADETPIPMLKPGNKKTHKAYLWAYAPGAFEQIHAVVYDFCETRAGQNARTFLGKSDDDDRGWRGSLVCDDYGGYKSLFTKGVKEAGCMAHARRKLFELHANHSSLIAAEGLKFFDLLYDVERDIKSLPAAIRLQIRQEKSRPIADLLHQWLLLQASKVPSGSATAKAINYSIKRWEALTLYLDDGQVPIDNNWCENQIRPAAVGRGNWLFAGSLRAGQRAAAVMSLIQSAKLNGHDPYAYLKDVLTRLPTQRASQIGELLPHNWAPQTT